MFGEFINELPNILIWYFIFLILGVAGLPVINKYFSNWKDRGYGVSKFISLAFITLPLWLLSSLKIIPFTQLTTILILIIYIAFAVYVGKKTKFTLNKAALKWIIWEEIMFLLVFLIWTFIRSTNSQVEGTEKMMNIAFMNSIWRTEYFPALDPWMSGGYINYYHLGHYMYSFISKMTGVPISFAYNFALNTIAGFSFIASFSIIVKLINSKHAIKASVLSGLFGASWMMFGSNLHYLYKWLEAVFKNKTFEYWFPDGTRIITNAIDEFPAYSIPLGDLHGHYLGMPFIIVVIALLIVSFRIKIGSKAKLYFYGIISFLVVGLYGINSWDFITTMFLFGVLNAYQAFTSYKLWADRVVTFLAAEAALLLPGLLFMIPYIINFHPPVGGIGIVPFAKTSEIIPWLQMWGMFVAISALYVILRASALKSKSLKIVGIIVLSLVLLMGLYANLQFPYDAENLFQFKLVEKADQYIREWVEFFAVVGGFVGLVFASSKFIKNYIVKSEIKIDYKVGKYEMLVILLTFGALALIMGVEFVFVKDIFYRSNPPYFRTNTVFKFYYHAWVIWTIACSFFTYKIFTAYLKSSHVIYRLKGAFAAFLILLMYIGSVTYIFEAVKDFYPFFKYDNSVYPTVQQLFSEEANDHIKIYDSINGNMYIKKNHTDDYAVIDWFNKNVTGQPIIAEAVGDAYTYYARISANTGLVSVMGWPTHEWQWRSNPIPKTDANGKVTYEDEGSKMAFERKDEVKIIYTTTDINEFKRLVDKYNVTYIIYGELEKEAYNKEGKQLNENMVSPLYTKVFESGDSRIYKLL